MVTEKLDDNSNFGKQRNFLPLREAKLQHPFLEMNLKITSSIKRIKQYVTLTASAYQPLLCKHVVLATMQCKEEVKKNIEIF